MKKNSATFCVAFVLVAIACKQERPNTPEVQPPPAAITVKPAAPQGLSLPERLTAEAQARPAAALRAENIFAAVVQTGVEITERTQYLASSLGAGYCQNAKTKNDLSITVCEFESDEAATKGRAAALAAVPVANRRIEVHHATTLQIIEAPPSVQSAKLADAVVSAFNAL